MLSIFKVSAANIKRRKGQNLLIALIILSMALIFSTSISILSGLNKPFDKMFESLKASQLTLTFSNRVHSAESTSDWWKSQRGVESVQVLNQYWLKDQVYFNGSKLSATMLVTEMTADPQKQDILMIIEGAESEKPNPGEMWLPITFADNNKIKVGDMLEIPTGDGTEELRVSALVVDPYYASSFFNPTRVWVAPGQLSSMFPLSSLNNVSMGIRFNDYSRASKLWNEFEAFLQQPYSGLKVDYETIYFANLFTYQLIGTILLILSVIIILIALFIVYFTITNAILSEYKTIGILKSQGFSSINIISIYAIQYFIISLIVIPAGIALSKFTSTAILRSLVRALGLSAGNVSILIPGIITFTLLAFVIVFVACLTSIKGGKVKPAEAIRYGAPEKDFSNNISIPAQTLIKLPIPMILGIKDIFSNKRQSLFLAAATAVTALVIAFSLNLNYSINKVGENAAFWGYDNSDIMITSEGTRFTLTHDDLMERFKNEPNIDIVIPGGGLTNCSIIDEKTNTSKPIFGNVYDGDLNSSGMLNIEGRHPENENEVALAVGTSRELNKRPGDTVDIYIDGVRMGLLVTGVYQSTNNSGHGFRIQESAVRIANPTYVPHSYYVTLRDKSDIKGYTSSLKGRLGTSVSIDISKETMVESTRGIISNIGIMVIMIVLVFTLVCFITIFNLTSINIHHNKKNYGIYKSTGMTSQQIRLSILSRIIFITLLGLLVGIPIGLSGAPLILNLMVSSLGILKFPYSINPYITALVVPLCALITGVSAWMPSKRVLELNPRTLIVE